jgi:hypothetical protein
MGNINVVTLTDWQSFFWILIGVITSALFPVAVKILKPDSPTLEGEGLSRGDQIVKFVEPYLKYAFASMIVSFITLVAIRYTGSKFTDWYQPVLTGYFWDSTLQKVREGLK